jgi:hypothetical protein
VARIPRSERRSRGEPELVEQPAGAVPRAPSNVSALLALQRQAGNHAVAQMVQRMQLVAADPGAVDSDPVVLMNIRHGRAVNQGKGVDANAEKIASFGDAYSGDDLDVDKGEIVFLHGHGLTGMYRDEFILRQGGTADTVTYEQAADVVATKLKTVTNEQKKGKPYTIRILTCRGGNPGLEHGSKIVGPMPSLVKALQAKLADAPSEIKIKGFVEPAFSYPGFKTHQEPSGFTDKGYALHLEKPFEEFKTWLANEGAGSSYQARLKKIEELIPEDTVKAFIESIRGEGAYTTKDLAGEDDPRRETFVKVFNKTT